MAELPKAAQGTFDELLEGVEPDLAAIARLYEEGEAANLAKVNQEPANIAALTAAVIHQSAMRYLDTANYVQVTLMPEKK